MQILELFFLIFFSISSFFYVLIMIFEDENGKRTYYYYKKRVGRPKKRGRKKKKKLRGRRWQEPWNYKLIQCDFRKQNKVIGYFHDLIEADNAKKILLKENEEVKIPKKYSNNGRISNNIYDFLSEYVILEKNRGENTKKTTKLRNEYGKIVNVETTNEKWTIFDRFPHLIEEDFWVYGFNPKNGRKNYDWIEENMINYPLSNNVSLVIRVYVYLNKVLIRYDIDDIEFVICKNSSDSARLYNKLEETFKKHKRIVFCGSVNSRNDTGKKLIKILLNKTGWDERKIKRNSTRS